MGNKITDHNGKEVKKNKGKNIRVSETGWNKIRKYCLSKGLVMGTFVETSSLKAMKP